jgi:hypothetical protein
MPERGEAVDLMEIDVVGAGPAQAEAEDRDLQSRSSKLPRFHWSSRTLEVRKTRA